MAGPPEDVLSEPGRRSPLIVAVVMIVVIAVVSWVVSLAQPPAEQTDRGAASESPLIYPVGPSYASAGPTFAPAASPCTGPTATPSPSPAPQTGRLRSGNLSYAIDARFRRPVPSRYLAFGTGVWLQSQQVFSNDSLSTPAWTAVVAIGRLERSDGFTGDGATIARRVLGCLLALDQTPDGDLIARVTAAADTPVFPDTTGSMITADVVIPNDTGFPGERITIVVVADGDDWSFLLASMPIGSGEADDVADRALASLRVDG